MKNNLKILLSVIIVIFISVFIFVSNKESPVVDTPQIVIKQESVVGCYVAKLSKDVYVLKIDSDSDGNIFGKLAFNNYEKDSSSGVFTGTYKDGILLGNYSFESEGMHSDRQAIFKKVGDNFIEGFGPVKVIGDKEVFENIANITYDSNSTFIKSNTCVENFTELNNKFTFSHNSFFKAYGGQNILGTDWRGNTKQKGILLARVSVPNTKFSNAYFTVGSSIDSKEIKSCNTLASIFNHKLNISDIIT